MADGTPSPSSTPLDSFALVAGVSGYRRIRTLPAVKDVEDVAAVLRDRALCGFAPSKVEVLREDAATRTALLDALERLVQTARPSSSVFVYFSGHGGRIQSGPAADCYLMPYEGAWASPDDLVQTALSGKVLSERLRAIPARRVTVVLDCCRAAGLVEPKGDDAPALDPRMPPDALAPLAEGRGRAVLAASRADGVSLAVEGRRDSVFTEHLVAGLRGAATGTGGVIRVCDLFHYVQQKVIAEFPDQRPVFKADLEENYALALYKGGEAPHVALPSPPDGCMYDAYVSYRREGSDRTWVEQTLVPRLEGLGLRLCLAQRNFRLGAPRIREMERAVQRSRYTLAVLSRQYLEGALEEFQMLLAQYQAVEAREPRFVPLMREECPLPLGIRMTERLDVSDGVFEDATLQRLAERLRESYRDNWSA
jgi:hypothetical protein